MATASGSLGSFSFLAASSHGAATTTGVVSAALVLSSATSHGQATQTAQVVAHFGMVATSHGTATTVGKLGVKLVFAASSAGHAAATGVFGRALSLSASSSVGLAVLSATLSNNRPLAALTAGHATTTATLLKLRALAASSAGVATASALLGIGTGLRSTSTGVATSSGTLKAAYALSGTLHGAATTSGNLVRTRSIVASSAGAATVTGALRRIFNLSSASAGVATAQGTLRSGLSGESHGVAVATATVTRKFVLAANASHGVATATGSIHGRLALSSTSSHGVATATGGLAQHRALAAFSHGVATAVGTLLGRSRVLQGISNGIATVSNPSLTTPTTHTVILHGARSHVGVLRVVKEFENARPHGTRTRVGTLAANLGGVVTAHLNGSRSRTGTAANLSIDSVTALTAHLASARSHDSSILLTGGPYEARGLKGSRDTRSGTLFGRVIHPIVAHLKATPRSRTPELAATLIAIAAPPNDEISGVITLSPNGGSLRYDNTYATANASEPAWPGPIAALRSLWYVYTAPSDGIFRISTGPVNVDTGPYLASRLGLYSSPALNDYAYADLTQLVAVDAVASYDPDGLASFIALPLTAGQFVWVRVDAASNIKLSDLNGAVAAYGIGPASLGWDFNPTGASSVSGISADADVDGVITPGNLVITMGNLPPSVTVNFVVDGTDPADAIDSLDIPDAGALINTSVWLPNALTAGEHLLYGFVGSDIAFTIPFVAISEPADDTGGAAVDPVLIPRVGVQRWVFQDPTNTPCPTGTPSWVVPLNPNKMNTPFRDREISTGTLVGVSGDAVIWEADGPLPQWTFSGTILHGDPSDPTSHLSMLTYFASLQYPIYIIDHFNRAWTVYMQSFQPVPTDARWHPFKHDYTVVAYALKPPVQLT